MAGGNGSSAAIPLTALAVGAFAIGVTEFSPMGLLPEIAGGVHVSVPKAGALVSAYALGVLAGAPTMTLLLARLRQKTALLLLMAILAVGNALSAAAPGFLTLVGTRVLTSLCHGAFFGIGAVLAASLVPSDRQASAVATMFMGLTIANVGGVPAATWIGQQVGWRITFAGIGLLGLVAVIVLVLALPRGETCGTPDARKELGVIARPSTLIALATTVAGAGAMFTTYTYVAPMMRAIGGAGGAAVTLGLVAIGIGFTVGNWLGGRLADRAATPTLVTALAVLATTSLAQPLLLRMPMTAFISLAVWGAAAFGVVPPVQTLVMRRAAEAPGLASSINIGAFNLGNALGAAAGGAVLSLGLGYGAISPAGALLAIVGIAFALGSARMKQESVA